MIKFIILGLSIVLIGNNLNSYTNDRKYQQLFNRVTALETKLMYTNVKARVTAYSPTIDETDSTPYETASLLRPEPWTIAVSRDLFNNGWTYGKYVYINDIGRFKILDCMNKKATMSVDIFLSTKKQAQRFGVKDNVSVALLEI